MLRIIDQYLLKEFIRNLFLSVFGLTLIFFIMEYLKGVWDSETTPFMLLHYQSYDIPRIFSQMLAPSAMLATAFTLSNLNRKHELTAMQAAGIGMQYIAGLLMAVVLAFCAANLFFQDRVIPVFSKWKTTFYWKEIKHRKDFSIDIRTSKIWYRSQNLIYNLQLYDPDSKTIQGIGIYYFGPEFRLLQYIQAQTARFDEESSKWFLKSGMITLFSQDNPFPMTQKFNEKELMLPDTPKDFIEIERQVESLRLGELMRFIERNKAGGLKTEAYEVDFHSRIAIAFVALIMSLLAIPYSVTPKRQGGIGKDLTVCMGWIVAFWLSFSFSLSLGKSGAIIPWMAVWTVPIFFLMVAIFLILREKLT